MEEVPHDAFSEVVDAHLKTSDDSLPREMMQLSLSCEKITEADQEDCSLIVDDNQNATPQSSEHRVYKQEHDSQTKQQANGDLERRRH